MPVSLQVVFSHLMSSMNLFLLQRMIGELQIQTEQWNIFLGLRFVANMNYLNVESGIPLSLKPYGIIRMEIFSILMVQLVLCHMMSETTWNFVR